MAEPRDSHDLENDVVLRERTLRAWFTQGKGPEMAEVDGLDIGFGGVQRWATARMPFVPSEHTDESGLHTECGKTRRQPPWLSP